jgi:hypothetical protein
MLNLWERFNELPAVEDAIEELQEYSSEDSAYLIYDAYDELYREVEGQSANPPRRKEDPDLADILDLFLELVEASTEVNLEQDILDYLEGTLVLAVEEFDAVRIERNPTEEAINAVAMLSYRSEGEEPLEDTLDDLSDLIEDGGYMDSDTVDLGADNDARIFEPDFFGIETDYAPGYVFHDGYLIFGTTKDALENVVSAQKGDVEDLASLAEYRRAVSSLPGERQFLYWVSMQRIVAELNADDMNMTDDEFEALEEVPGSLAIVATFDEELVRASLSLTFFPE